MKRARKEVRTGRVSKRMGTRGTDFVFCRWSFHSFAFGRRISCCLIISDINSRGLSPSIDNPWLLVTDRLCRDWGMFNLRPSFISETPQRGVIDISLVSPLAVATAHEAEKRPHPSALCPAHVQPPSISPDFLPSSPTHQPSLHLGASHSPLGRHRGGFRSNPRDLYKSPCRPQEYRLVAKNLEAIDPSRPLKSPLSSA